ncbi:MAG: hypothetical protein JO218_05690, partial [Burkholderiales bacterium]|nr:hypothetical protein [Burkholderiales bacterium]
MTSPYLVQAVPASGSGVYSVSADTNAYTTMNVTPLTDLMVRTWYGVQGSAADTAYANPVSNPAPSPANVATIQAALQPVMQLWLNQSQVGSNGFSFVSTPFVANGSGEDQVLSETKINTGTGVLTVSGNGISQSSTISFSSATSSVSIATTTTGSGGTSTSLTTSVIPSGSAAQTAVTGINATLSNMASTVSSRGSALSANDLLPYLDPNLLNDGENANQFATDVASDLGGSTLNLSINQIISLDTVNNIADVEVTATQTANGQSQAQPALEFHFHQINGQWLLSGNGRPAHFSLQAEARVNGGILAGASNGPDINLDVQAPAGTVSSVTVTGGGVATNQTLAPSPTVVRASGKYDHFVWNSGVLSQLIPAGTAFTFTVMQANGKSSTTTLYTNVFTTELMSLTNPTSDNLSVLNLGSPTTVTWTLPTTFAVAAVDFNAQTYTGSQLLSSTLECDNDVPTGNGATSVTITIPKTCNGLPVMQVDLGISATGVNGERSYITFGLQ